MNIADRMAEELCLILKIDQIAERKEIQRAFRRAAVAYRESCAAHVEEVFCDGSAPELLENAYRAVANSIRGMRS